MKTIRSCQRCGGPLAANIGPCPQCEREEFLRAAKSARLFQGFVLSAALDRLRQALRMRAA